MAGVDMSPAGQSLVELFQKLSTADDVSTAANALASHVKTSGLDCWAEAGLTEKLKDVLEGKDKAAAVGAAAAVKAFIDTHEAAAEPYVYSLLTPLLAKVSDKAPEVCQAAEAAARALVNNTSAAAIKPKMMPNLLSGMDRVQKPATKVLALNLLADLAETHPTKVADCMSSIVSAATELMGEAKKDVKEAAHRAMTAACQVCGNHDIQPFVPILVSCMANHDELHNCIHKLAATTFVQSVEEPALAILVPLLCMGLLDRARAIKRKSCLIVDNMSKLVDDPTCAAPFMPRIMPLLERAADEISDPEARSVAERALVTLRKIDTEGKALANQRRPDEALVKQQLADALAAASIEAPSSAAYTQAVEYVCVLCCELILRKIFESDIWANAAVVGYLAPFLGEAAAKAVCSDFLQRCKVEDEKMAAAFEEEEEEGEDLCKCDFSLAYGAKILLNNTSLHLKRGKRYGLCGPNGCGKSTLMRAIANGQVEGFPPPDVLKTVYVEHDLDDSVAEVTVLDLLLMDERFEGRHEEVVSTLASVGYCDGREKMLVSELSGGWRMKLALARAMLLHPDILLLDEPTNHLDVTNVAWLQDYLVGLDGVSSMIVSHDSSFLDTVCTHIIHYEMRKLKVYRGNLSKFVQKVPEAQSYYELEATPISWKFPEPGYLEGVKTKDKALLKMQDVSFTYPSADQPTLTGISLQVSLSSRVACIGGNGAGKSTLIKVLTGEMEATGGTVWRHPNARIAYVAQHAFHHIEQHLDWTPNQYIQWRYASGEDREEQEKVSRKIDEDEEKKMKEAVKIDGIKRKVEKVLGRRKAKKGGYEYEVQWENTGPEANSWMSRRELEDLGFGKLVNEVDAAEAARLGLMTRPLTSAAIEKHLNDIGLEPEFATHSQMRGLSGGQKVKVVIGAAMWNNPHIVVLDEPTNFLDRDSLGAMAGAIREYDGGVVIISHNQEFTKKLCPEVWTVANGSMTMTGNNYKLQDKTKVSQKKLEEMTDALGNTVKVKGPAKKLSRKELKAKERARAQKRAAGLPVSDDEDDF